MAPSRPVLCPLNHMSCLLTLGFTIIQRHTIRPRKFPLTKLPVELIQEIAAYLPVEDVGSLRLTGKAVERAVFDLFVRRFFKTKQFRMINKRSRQILDDISRHPIFSKALEHLILATEMAILCDMEHFCGCPDCNSLRRFYEEPHRGPDDKSDSETNAGPDGDFRNEPDTAFVPGSEDCLDVTHSIRPWSCSGRSRMSNIFRRLPNIKTVQQRDFKGPMNHRAVTESELPDYGWPREFTFDEYFTPEVEKVPNEMFSATLVALATADVRPTSLEVVYNRHSECLSDVAFDLQPASLAFRVAHVLACLNKLELYLHPDFSSDYPTPNNAPYLQRFLSLTTNLTELRLRWTYEGDIFDAYHLLAWLGRQPGSELPHGGADMAIMGMAPSDDVPEPVHFPRLERLHLDFFCVPPETVASVVSKFRSTLRALHFINVRLVDLRNRLRDRAEIWGPLLKLVAQETDLREWRIHVGFDAGFGLYYPCDESPKGHFSHRKVYFAGGLAEMAYSGEDANARLAAAADDVRVLWDGEIDVPHDGA